MTSYTDTGTDRRCREVYQQRRRKSETGGTVGDKVFERIREVQAEEQRDEIGRSTYNKLYRY